MTGDVKGLEFYVSSAKALPEIERFEGAIDRVARAVEASGTTIDALDSKLTRLGQNKGSAGLDGAATATKKVSAAVREIIDQKRREVEIEKLGAQERSKRLLILEAERRLGFALSDADKQALGAASQQLAVERQRIQQRREEATELARIRKEEAQRAERVAAITQSYASELAIARLVGAEQEVLRARIQAQNDAKQLGLSLDSQAAKKLEEIAVATAKASIAAKDRAAAEQKAARARDEALRQEDRARGLQDRRDEAIRSLVQEERAVRLARVERERYRRTVEAEAAARAAGLAIGSREYQDFVRRTVAVRELAAAQDLAEKRQSAFGSSLGRLGITAGGVLRTITQLTAGFGALYAVRSAVNAIADSEDKLRILQSVTDATADELDRLAAAANTLALETRFSFGDGTQTLINLAKAGATAEESITALPSVANLARAGLLQLDVAADTVIQTMAQFGLTIRDSTRIGDVLVKAADSTTSSVDSLADSLRKVGPVGREFGISLETVTAAIALMQQSGVQARVAGTGLAQVFKQLADPVNGPEGAAEALARLNLSFDDVNPRNFTGALDKLAAAGLTLQDATALVGTEFDYLLTTLVRNREEVKRLESALNSASGDAATKAAATVGTLGDSFAKLGNAAQRFYREGGKAGASKALSEIAIAGADALNVLSGDAAAMEKAGTAGYVLATGAKAAGVAIAGIITFNTLARVGSFAQAMFGAGKAVGALNIAVRANPIGALAAVAASAATAMFLFGDSVGSTSSKLQRFQDDAAAAEAVARRFDDLRRSAELAASATPETGTGLSEALKEQLILLERARQLGEGFVPSEGILSALEQAAPDTIAQLRRVTEEISQLGKSGQEAPDDLREAFDQLNSKVFVQFGVSLRSVRGAIVRDFFGGIKVPTIGFIAETEKAIAATSKELGRLTGDADAAAKALSAAEQARTQLAGGRDDSRPKPAEGERKRTDALREYLLEKQREIDFADLAEDKQRRAKLLQEATNAAIASGRKLRFEDLVALEAIARLQDQQAKGQTDEKRAEAVQKIIRGLQDENALLELTGSERDALQKQQETLNALADLKVDKASEEYQLILDLLDANGQLLDVEEKRARASRGQDGRDRRSNQALLQLEQEEKMLGLLGNEREAYLLRIDAENQARQAGLELGTAEFDDYVKRRVAVERLADAQERLASVGAQAGDAIGSSLERLIFDGTKARDVIRSLAEDLGRLAFRQTVTQGISSLLSQAGVGLANYFGGGGINPATGAVSGQIGPLQANGTFLRGGIIPAMSGQVVDEFSFLRRGDQNYSVAEGGKTTPEGIFRLARDNKGNLGVTAVGGGGGDNVTMIFPGVRNAQDARAMRMTVSQRYRAVKASDRSGRVGLRPPT